MKINLTDAFNILGISAGNITAEEIKQAYRRAAQKYHPDRNPAGHEMMQAINAAYESIKDFNGEVYTKDNNQDYGDQLNAALNAVIGLGMSIEICGAWIWLSGNTKQHKEKLKVTGYKWAPKKSLWYFRPEEYKSRNHKSWSMDEIRNKYGSEQIQNNQGVLCAA